MIYLASPYTHEDPEVVESRYLATVKVMAILLNKGLFVYSPIVHCHVIAKNHKLPTDYLFWMSYNDHFLGLSDEMFILCIDGWKDSKGIKYEIENARVPIKYIDINGEEIKEKGTNGKETLRFIPKDF